MSFFGRLRLEIKYEGVEIAAEQQTLASRTSMGTLSETHGADSDAIRDAEAPPDRARKSEPPRHQRRRDPR